MQNEFARKLGKISIFKRFFRGTRTKIGTPRSLENFTTADNMQRFIYLYQTG